MVHSTAAVLFAALFALVLIAAREAVSSANAAEDPDTQFAFSAAARGMSEVKLEALAALKGTDPSAKQFGQRMVTDYSKAGDELKSLAIQSKITLRADVSKSEAETYAKLSKLPGAEFDKAYANEMGRSTRKTWRNFRRKR
jgi:putative membrane protein